ncbi:MAG: LysR family transcriptional regulator [Bermanella sp.]
MDFNKARTFVEVADCGNITQAANRLLRTQQAISLQLQQLEEELELNLFDRHGPKITLTQDGQHLYQVFKPRLLEMDNAVLELKLDKQQAAGVIRIGAWMEQAVSYLPEMMRIFKQQHPRVEFELVLGGDMEIEQMLKDNLLDLGFQVYCQDKKMFKCEAIYRQPLLPVVSRNFLKTQKPPKNIESTLDVALLDYNDEYSAYNQWIKKNARPLLPLARKKVRAITTTNNVVLKQLVLQGLGMGFLHKEAIQAELDIGELIPVLSRSKAKNIQVELDVVYKRKQALPYVHQAFLSFLRENKSSWMV